MSVDRMPLVDENQDQEAEEPSTDVARQVPSARIREAELAMTRHLEVLQDEAARRCELTIAQAELDAQLIRLEARRDAHAIVAGAGGRTVDGERVAGMTELLSDFAEVLDELRPGSL